MEILKVVLMQKKQTSCVLVSNISSTCALMIGAVYQSVEWSGVLPVLLAQTHKGCCCCCCLLRNFITPRHLNCLPSPFLTKNNLQECFQSSRYRAKSRIKWVWIKIVESRLRSLGPGFPPTTVEKCAAMCSVLCCSVLCSVCRLCIDMFSVKFVLCCSVL